MTGADFYSISTQAINGAVEDLIHKIEKFLQSQNISLEKFKENPGNFGPNFSLDITIEKTHIEETLKQFTPSISPQESLKYLSLKEQYADLIIE